MTGFPFDVVAFDLDGTLADTASDLAASLNHVLTQFGRDTIDAETVRHLVGHGARALLRKGFAATGESSEQLVEQGFPLFIDYYSANMCAGSFLYPGVEAALDALSAQGVALALCTNKPEGLTIKLLAALGWSNRFHSVVAGDTFAVRKPDPAPLHAAILRAGGGRAAFVGDSIIDADTARAARTPFIAVSFGFSDRPVEDLGADLIIDDYGELIPALIQLSELDRARAAG
jgi:phosphoglycolate phosphatase